LISLILSLDYEMFGNGAGDAMRDIIHPTSRVLNICDKYGARMSIMFEDDPQDSPRGQTNEGANRERQGKCRWWDSNLL